MRALLVLVLLTSVAHADYELRPRTPRVPPAPRPQVTQCWDMSIIKRAIKAQMPKFTKCYEDEVRRDPKSEGRLVADFVIGPNGRVTKSEATGVSPQLERCIAKRMSELRFPKTGAGVRVTYPFNFAGEITR